jgi:hypothetical protein
VEILSGNDLTRALYKHRQNLEGLLRQSDANSVLAELSGLCIKLKNAESNPAILWRDRHH